MIPLGLTFSVGQSLILILEEWKAIDWKERKKLRGGKNEISITSLKNS